MYMYIVVDLFVYLLHLSIYVLVVLINLCSSTHHMIVYMFLPNRFYSAGPSRGLGTWNHFRTLPWISKAPALLGGTGNLMGQRIKNSSSKHVRSNRAKHTGSQRGHIEDHLLEHVLALHCLQCLGELLRSPWVDHTVWWLRGMHKFSCESMPVVVHKAMYVRAVLHLST